MNAPEYNYILISFDESSEWNFITAFFPFGILLLRLSESPGATIYSERQQGLIATAYSMIGAEPATIVATD